MTTDCGNHDDKLINTKAKKILAGIGAFCILFGLTVFIVFLVLRPTKPSFALRDASILNLDLSTTSTSNLLSSTLQVTIFSRNPNARVGIYYHSLKVYASYQDQQITISTSLPSTYQATHGDVSLWSPYLYGPLVPIAPSVATSLAHEVLYYSSRPLLLDVRIDGRVSWTVGSWRSGLYHIHVHCPVVFRYYRSPPIADGTFVKGLTSTSAVGIRQISSCRVDV